MPAWVWIVLGLLAAGTMMFWSVRYLVSASERAARRALALVAGEQVLLEARRANFAGLASRGSRQVRGTGALVLTPTRLAFVQWATGRELLIDRDRITGAELGHRHAGKATGARMIKVRFTGPDGREDGAAWQVADAGAWLDALAPQGPGEPG